jgi:diaminopropionate ammonia-lyase
MPVPTPFRLLINPRAGVPGIVTLPAGGFRRAAAEIAKWPAYAPTPLLDLAPVAAECGVAAIGIKDEAGRFGLGSFKALGGAYAVARLLIAELARRGVATSADLVAGRHEDAAAAITVTCATDGNHGRSVAWAAQRFGARCVIFVHDTVSQGRIDAIARYGAEIRVVPGTYDDAVRAAARAADTQGWFVVSDTSWSGYTSVPVDIMQGYRLMADEAADQWGDTPPTHVFIQGGVGGVAASVAVQMRARFRPMPRLVVVEPENAACLLASAEAGVLTAVPGELDTIMAGLACGEPSLLAWQELDRAAFAFMAVPDSAAVNTMRLLAGLGMVSGESGVAGLAALRLAAADPAARAALGLDARSRVLLFSTEGATDPELYDRLVFTPDDAAPASRAGAGRTSVRS